MDFARQLSEQGYAIIPDVLALGNVQGILESFAQLNFRRSRAGARHILSYPRVAAVASSPRMLPIARAILGPDTFPFRATFFDKSQTANWLVAWHQDTALPLRSRSEAPGWGPWSVKEGIHYAHAPARALEQVLALRLHLDDSRPENGPLRVLPATHKMGILSDEEVHELACRVTPTECTVGAGGILAMHPLAVHASSKSQSSAARRVLHIEYAANSALAAPLELAIA